MNRNLRTRSGIASKYLVAVVVVVVLVAAAGYGALTLGSSTTSTSSTSTTLTSSTTSQSTAAGSSSSSISSQSTSSSTTTTEVLAPPANPPTNNSISTVRIGYFANLNHAPALIGLSNGDFQKFVGPSTTIQTTLFTSGSPEMTALLANKIDMAYVGPSPAVNAYIASNGTALQIVSGVANGGAVFVVRNASNINSVKDFGGKTFAAPGVGNTQDVALRHYLIANGYGIAPAGNVTVEDTSNANIVTLMVKGQIDGAWVPEPWGAILVAEAGAHIFLNEASLWPNGFSTAELVVSTSFLQAHPDVVKEVVAANLYEIQWIQNNPQQAASVLNNVLGNLTGGPVGLPVVQTAMTRLNFTDSPLEASVLQQAQNAFALKDLGSVAPTAQNLSGLYNLTILNSILETYGLPQVTN
jgi:NitT/TauT family transport system substrate-binding protein